MSRCGVNGSAERSMRGLKRMPPGERREGSIWLHRRSGGNRVEVDLAFSRFMEKDIDSSPGLCWPTMVPPRCGTTTCLSVFVHPRQRAARSTSICYRLQYKRPGKGEQEMTQALHATSSWLPPDGVTLRPSVGKNLRGEAESGGSRTSTSGDKARGENKKASGTKP